MAAVVLCFAAPSWAQADEYGRPYSNPQTGYAQPYEPPSYPQDAAPAVTPAQPLDAAQLEQLVAPIALYPDALVAQMLAASTYPRQVEDADRWRQAQGGASPGQIAAWADVQPWDPSVKALTAFPQVLANMDRNLQWTTDLGNAYYNQPQDVLEAVQVMRQRAQAAGSLQSSPQEEVRYNDGVIQLAPVNPEVVYVPSYDPWTVYGDPVSPYPGFSLFDAIGSFFTSAFSGSPLRFGLGIAMSAFAHTPWGWLAWGLDWLGHALLFNNSGYFSHSDTVADWGFSHRGFHAYSGGHFGRGGFGGDRFEHMQYAGNWRRGGGAGNGWHSFGRGNDAHTNWERGAQGLESRGSQSGFHSFGDTRGTLARREPWSSGRTSVGRTQSGREFTSGMTGRAAYGSSFDRAPRQGSSRIADYRAAGNSFQHGAFGQRSSAVYAGGSSGYGKAQRSGGLHLFGGGHSQKNFGGGGSNGIHGGAFHGGGSSRPPKISRTGGGKGIFGGHSGGGGHFGGGGHSHGGGGHSGGGHGGGGKHHH